MNEHEEQQFEAELRRTPPARLPEQLLARLRAAQPRVEPVRRTPVRCVALRPGWRAVWRWLAPAVAVAVVGFFFVPARLAPRQTVATQPVTASTGLKADDVQVDHELVSSYDVIATLPGGQPVRFRCRQLRDQWVVTDKARGVEIEESRPRVEVTPVRFETY